MKRVIYVLTAILITMTASVSGSKAQVNVNINIGAQPLWGPVGYDVANYYYLPDVQAYYYVPSRQFIYLNGGNWVFAYNLPVRYDLYSGYKVVINEPRPYLHFASHKVKYAKYKGWKGRQAVIRDSRDSKYYAVKGHPGKGHGGGRGGGKGHGGGHGKGKH